MWHTIKSWLGGESKQAGAEDAQSDRRIWVRRPCDLEAFYQSMNDDFGGRQAARVRNISRGGMSVVVKQRFTPGDQLSVELPGDDDRPAYNVLACIVHAVEQPSGEWTLGCNFAQELSDEDLLPFGARRERPAASDQRAWQRFPCAVEGTYQLVRAPDGGQREATVVNISANGVGLLLNVAIEVGTLLNLHLHRAGEHSDLEILACVVRVTQVEVGQWLLGCNFISELSEEQARGLL
jgi:c-di-GMP-binding flagellar brake protein YcgR